MNTKGLCPKLKCASDQIAPLAPSLAPITGFLWFKESGFDPLADSGYAKGYAQFTDDTIKELKRLKFIDDDFDIWDPEQSKSASKKYIN